MPRTTLPLLFLLGACGKSPPPPASTPEPEPAATDGVADVPAEAPEPPPEPPPPPEPHALAVTAWPPGASIEVKPASGEAMVRNDALNGSFVGPVTVSVSREGWDTETHVLDLDADATLDVWLEQKGQLLDRVRIVETCNQPKALHFAPGSNDLWMACMAPPVHTMARSIFTGEAVVPDVHSDTPVAEITMNAAGTRAYTSQLEVKQTREIDVQSGEVLRTFERMGLWPKYMTLSADESKLYVSAWLVGTLPETNFPQVTEVDLETGNVSRRLETVKTPRGLYATGDGKYLYVAGFEDGQLDRIDLETGEHEVLFSGGTNLRHVVGDDERGRIYVSDMGKHAVFVYDVATGETTQLAKVQPNTNTIALSKDKEVLFVSCRGEDSKRGYLHAGEEFGTMAVVDAVNGGVLDVVVLGNQPTGLAVSPDGKYVAVSNFRDHDAHIFEIPSTQALRQGGGGRRDTFSLLKVENPGLPDALAD